MPGEETLSNKGQISQAVQEMLEEVRDLPLEGADVELAATYAQMMIDGVDQKHTVEWLNASIMDERKRTATRALATVIAVEHVSNVVSRNEETIKNLEEILATRGLTIQALLDTENLTTAAFQEIISEIRQRSEPQQTKAHPAQS